MQILIPLIFIFLLARLSVAAYNYYSNPRLTASRRSSDELVSILIPARNEAQNLHRILNSVLGLKGVKYEVIVLDDHSEDETFSIASSYGSKHEAIQVIRGKPLKKGWTGKNYACWQLAEVAKGDYLLFVDADVNLHPLLLSSALHRLKEQELSLLSLFSNQQMLSLAEQSTVPLMHYLLLTLLPLKLILGHRFAVFSAACGQFMLFSAKEYHLYRWHDTLRGKVAEDLGIMKALKEAGLRGEGLMANGLVSCRMYRSFNEAIMGFSKNFMAPFDNRLSLFLPFIVTLSLGPLFIIATGDLYQLVSLILIIFSTRIYTSKLAGEDWRTNSLLHPLQMLNLLIISGAAVQQHLFKNSVWKGRVVVQVPAGS
ncbi:glycosyltransferase [Pedobacter sp. GR22-6]|uniref:glycosyltransferase n=1 Tax=Pedobacter sp. GR22-6 TaxID=3127957 RepID=UPI00307FCEC0